MQVGGRYRMGLVKRLLGVVMYFGMRIQFKCGLYFSIAAILALAISSTLSTAALAQTAGRFTGDVILRVLPDGVNMQVQNPFSYRDSHGVPWPVPAGAITDGASIPSPLWSILGAPYTGLYREAAIVHDYYCVARSRHWKAVHKVFLDGMLARGVNVYQAKLMYLAVYRFGPRWDFDVDACFCKGCPVCANPIIKRVKQYRPEYKAADLSELSEKMKDTKYSLEELEDAADYQLNTEYLKRR